MMGPWVQLQKRNVLEGRILIVESGTGHAQGRCGAAYRASPENGKKLRELYRHSLYWVVRLRRWGVRAGHGLYESLSVMNLKLQREELSQQLGSWDTGKRWDGQAQTLPEGHAAIPSPDVPCACTFV